MMQFLRAALYWNLGVVAPIISGVFLWNIELLCAIGLFGFGLLMMPGCDQMLDETLKVH